MSEQIDPVYAAVCSADSGPAPAPNEEIGEEKTTELVDIITRSPGAKRTYDAYLAMVPEIYDAQKAILWDRMCMREDALAAWSDREIVKIFKKYKVCATKSRSNQIGTVISSDTKRVRKASGERVAPLRSW